jgi:hypothetical protein
MAVGIRLAVDGEGCVKLAGENALTRRQRERTGANKEQHKDARGCKLFSYLFVTYLMTT